MRANGVFVALLVAAVLAPSCVVREAMGRPPSEAEMAQIKAFSATHGPIVLQHVSPIATEDDGAASTARAAVAVGRRGPVMGYDRHNDPVVFTPLVKAALVTDHERGALLGGGIGALLGPLVGLIIVATAPGPGSGLDGDGCCSPERIVPVTAVLDALLCGALGYFIGTDHVFDFEASATQ